MAEPMSDERRAEIRRSVEAFRTWRTLLDPVNRVVIELHDELERSEADVERLRAALARVTDDSMIEQMAVATHKAVCLAPDHPECRPTDEDFRKAAEAIKAVRAVATGEQTEVSAPELFPGTHDALDRLTIRGADDD